MDDIKSKKQPFKIRRLYNYKNSSQIGVGRKIINDLNLQNEEYLKVYIDKINGTMLFKKLEKIMKRL